MKGRHSLQLGASLSLGLLLSLQPVAQAQLGIGFGSGSWGGGSGSFFGFGVGISPRHSSAVGSPALPNKISDKPKKGKNSQLATTAGILDGYVKLCKAPPTKLQAEPLPLTNPDQPQNSPAQTSSNVNPLKQACTPLGTPLTENYQNVVVLASPYG